MSLSQLPTLACSYFAASAMVFCGNAESLNSNCTALVCVSFPASLCFFSPILHVRSLRHHVKIVRLFSYAIATSNTMPTEKLVMVNI